MKARQPLVQTTVRRRTVSPAVIFWAVLTVLALVAALTNLGELSKLLEALESARWEFVAAAGAVQAVFVLNLALFYLTTFRATGVMKRSLPRFVLLTSAAHFVNMVSKTGGLGGITLYLREARHGDDNAARVSLAYLVAYALGYIAWFATLVIALVLLYLHGSLTRVEVIASAVILAIVLAVGGTVITGLRSRDSLARLFLLAARPLNAVARLLRRDPFVRPESVNETATELHDGVERIRTNPRGYAVPAAHALAVELLSALVLYLMAVGLHANIGFDRALAGYAIALLFSMIAITPSGLGFVEASLAVLLVSFGVPRSNAIVATLGYRLFEFWVPVALGGISLWLLRQSRSRELVA